MTNVSEEFAAVKVLTKDEFFAKATSGVKSVPVHEWNYKAATIVMTMAINATEYTAEDFGRVLQTLALAAPDDVLVSSILGMAQVKQINSENN